MTMMSSFNIVYKKSDKRPHNYKYNISIEDISIFKQFEWIFRGKPFPKMSIQKIKASQLTKRIHKGFSVISYGLTCLGIESAQHWRKFLGEKTEYCIWQSTINTIALWFQRPNNLINNWNPFEFLFNIN